MILQRTLISENIATDQSVYTIRFSEPLSLVEITSNKFISLSELQTTLTHLLEVIEEKKPLYILADTRRLNILGEEGQKWISNNFLPAFYTSSVTKFARIVEPDIFTQVVIESLLSNVQCEEVFGCSMQSFTDRESALDWLYS